jgi:RecG-like helicase
MVEIRKRAIAYKLKIGDLIKGNLITKEDKPNVFEINDKEVLRVNVVANVIDKYEGEGEKKFLSYTIDDASGQIKVKIFSDDVQKFSQIFSGDTVLVVGLLREYNGEIYINPEIMRKVDSQYLMVRKLELESTQEKHLEKEEVLDLREKIISMVREADEQGGIESSEIVMKIDVTHPETINAEIQKLLEEGIIYEPRPGKVRVLR